MIITYYLNKKLQTEINIDNKIKNYNNIKYKTNIINLKSNYLQNKSLKVYLCSSIPSSSKLIFKTTKYYHFELLKSCLQKAVRRRKPETAVRILYQLFSQDILNTLRRLPLIMLEDSLLYIRFQSLVVWLMVACNNNFNPSIEMIYSILNMIYMIALTDKVDRTSVNYDKDIDYLKIMEKNNQLINNTIGPIIIRNCYGGMKNDMQWMLYVAENWYKRLNNSNKKEWKLLLKNEYSKKIPIHYLKSLIENEELLQEDKLSEAIDFHCFRYLSKLVKKRIGRSIDEETVKSLIWKHRSSVIMKEIYL